MCHREAKEKRCGNPCKPSGFENESQSLGNVSQRLLSLDSTMGKAQWNQQPNSTIKEKRSINKIHKYLNTTTAAKGGQHLHVATTRWMSARDAEATCGVHSQTPNSKIGGPRATSQWSPRCPKPSGKRAVGMLMSHCRLTERSLRTETRKVNAYEPATTTKELRRWFSHVHLEGFSNTGWADALRETHW
jgi:hypothetical protein